jgi:hypothetical protein
VKYLVKEGFRSPNVGQKLDMHTRQPVQIAAFLIGAVFLLVGSAGFIPGLTTHFGRLGFANEDGARLLGLFGVNVVHNVLHMALGVAGIALSRTASAARTYLLAGGAAYLVLFIYGLAIDKGTQWNFAALNNADNWLHFILAVAMVTLGAVLPRRLRAHERHTVTA